MLPKKVDGDCCLTRGRLNGVKGDLSIWPLLILVSPGEKSRVSNYDLESEVQNFFSALYKYVFAMCLCQFTEESQTFHNQKLVTTSNGS